MLGELACSTLLYCLLSLVIVFPPQEAIASGITIENVMKFYLGSESLNFVYYHIRRTSVTIIAHCLLFPGYVATMLFFHPWVKQALETYHPWCTEIISFLSLIPLVISSSVVHNWSKDKWRNHPLARTIALYKSPERPVSAITEEINNEFVSIDKVASDVNSVSRIIATNSWLLKVTSYHIDLIQLRDAVLVLESCEDATIVPNSTAPAQLISVRVASLKDSVKSFSFKINSTLWVDLDRKLVNPVINTKQLVIHQTLADKFAIVFEEAVRKNPKERVLIELDSCIGCMAVKANVKLDRRCRDVDSQSKCTPCSCRPMWCISCLSKWFAAKQNPNQTDTWLSSSAPCPTCRSKFCLYDVSIIES